MSKVGSYTSDLRWAWVEIDQQALRYNVRQFKNKLARGVRMMCVVKADAYGHGAATCARIMSQAGADQFAVATVQEGVELRESGVREPIAILSEPPMECVQTLVEYDLEPSVYTQEFALAFGECASAFNKVGRYHLAIDTGMCRIGVLPTEAVEFRRGIDFHRGLECAGTFTHFATADQTGGWDFDLQYKRFSDTVCALQEAGLDCGLVHCNNTPATILHPETQWDMCRVGVGLYGMQPSESTAPYIDLRPAMSVRARVTRTAFPPVGAGVSYGFTYRIPKQNIQVATIPLGYADGLSRTLSNKMEVLVGGMRCRQVGNICMDQCMFAVDVNGVRQYHPSHPVQIGDLVTIMGVNEEGTDAIYAEDLSRLRGTINYEVTCNFGMRLEKLYI